jgi:predicted ATPase
MKLDKINLRGFKSIDSDGQDIPLGDVTVLLGANGAGTSCLVSFFKMLSCMMTENGLSHYVAQQGGANRLLYYGSEKTESISFKLYFSDEEEKDEYTVKLSHALPNGLFVSGEKVVYRKNEKSEPQEYYLKGDGSEIKISKDVKSTSKVLANLLRGIRAYQFHDTSDTAKIRLGGYVEDAKYLRADGGNLAAFLKLLQTEEKYQRYYRRIVYQIQRVMPQFEDFDLTTITRGGRPDVQLNWKDKLGHPFDPWQISDGSLRFMALTTLLLQPPELLPSFIVLDEPELGLHPSALYVLSGMIEETSYKAQVLIATQSTYLLDQFSPEQVLVIERDEKKQRSHYTKLKPKKLESWLERYCLSELWEKNVIGGKP